jgi:hypothetical protein
MAIETSSLKTKVLAIKAIITSEYFFVITSTGSHSTTPGYAVGRAWWARARRILNQHIAQGKAMDAARKDKNR